MVKMFCDFKFWLRKVSLSWTYLWLERNPTLYTRIHQFVHSLVVSSRFNIVVKNFTFIWSLDPVSVGAERRLRRIWLSRKRVPIWNRIDRLEFETCYVHNAAGLLLQRLHFKAFFVYWLEHERHFYGLFSVAGLQFHLNLGEAASACRFSSF